MNYSILLITLLLTCAMQAQSTINERIENQLKLEIYNDSGTNKIAASFKDIEEKLNILDFKSYSNYIFYNFKNSNNISGRVVKDLSLKEEDFKIYRNNLKQDTLFVNTLQQVSNNSLKKIEDKPSYDFDEVMNIACKFVKITGLNKNDNYVLKVCVGVNDLENTESKRDAGIEAFCFKSIFDAYVDSSVGLKDEIINEFQKITPISMGIKKEEKILRAQGALYVLIYNNKTFRDVLMKSYEANKNILPFAIKKTD